MTAMGSFNSPMALAVRPWGSLFFSFWAVFVISYCVQGFVLFAAPEFMETVIAAESPEAHRGRWTLILLGYVATLFLTMCWAETIGAGPFAASLKSTERWVIIGLVGGPVIMIFGNAIIASLFADGNPNWHLQDGVDASVFSSEATKGYAFVFTVLIAAPVLEEIAYRGVGLGCLLARGWSPLLSGFLVTLMFTMTHLHLTLLGLVPVFAAGAFFAWLRIRSGSLAPCIVGHVAANAAALAL